MLKPTCDNLKLAQAFVLRKWQERAVELGKPTPANLAGACKFSSLFAQRVFGGKLRGNWHHQYLDVDGQIVDLTDAAGVDCPDPYQHDRFFWSNPEHKASLQSCQFRVDQWVDAFEAQVKAQQPLPAYDIGS